MAVNSTVDFSSNCTFQTGSNCSGDPFYECIDSYPGNVFTGFITLVNCVLMLPVNVWILWLVRRTAGVASSDFVVLNQSVTEIIGEISLCTFFVSVLLKTKALALTCIFLSSTFMVGRPLFQAFFCVERYLAVVHPLVYLKYTKDPKSKVTFVGLVWLIMMIFGWQFVNSYPKMTTWFCTALIVAMLLVCSFCSLMILWVLKRPKPGDGEKEGAYQQKRKAFVVVTVILIMLVFGYGTVSCVVLLRDHLSYDTFCLALSLSWCTLLPVGAVQPYLYLKKVDKLPCIRNV